MVIMLILITEEDVDKEDEEGEAEDKFEEDEKD